MDLAAPILDYLPYSAIFKTSFTKINISIYDAGGMMDEFSSGAALITGGAGGIGIGIAQALAGKGLKLALADIDPVALEAAGDALRAQGAEVLTQVLDVRDREAWERAVCRVESELAPLQILCSNAGVAGSHLPIEQTDWEGWAWTIDINLHGTFNALKTCLPRLRAHRRRSHIVCTASLGAFLVGPGNAAYSATKAGVVAMCEALRGELAGTKVGISVLCPGLVNTGLLNNTRKLGPAVPLGSHSDEVAAAIKLAMAPSEVGERVVDGIRDNRFWLFTHADLQPTVAKRCEEILSAMDRGNPHENR